MLSLCMIVKNEEASLNECLKKAAGFVDEIVIVDTGSEDRTKEVASDFTDRVYDFKWCNDFSAARNFSISKATNDWIIVLDADEYINDFSRADVDLFIEDEANLNKVGRIKRINVIEAEFGNQLHNERINRIFNRKYFHYTGIIHEQVEALDGNEYDTDIVKVSVDHIGYTGDVVSRTNKIGRNIELLKIELNNNPNDSYILFQLGKSYYMLKDYKTSITYFKKALTFDLDYQLEYVVDLVESYGYALINGGRYSDAMCMRLYQKEYEYIPDFNFLMGLVYMNNSMFKEAIDSFKACTEFESGRVEGVTTYLPYYNIGVIYDVLGYREESIEYYRKCGNYTPALTRLKEQLN